MPGPGVSQVGLQTIGRYQVVRPLGEGGMGQVYLARDPDLDREVALKLLHGHDDRSKRERFRAEARSIAALRHPGIVTIYEIAEHDGRQYIAMEYLPGRSMRELIEAGEDVSTLLRICQHVGEAVAAAHAQGILHRDIKPENVVVSDDTVKVVDFGLARRLDTVSGREAAGISTSELRRAQTTAVVDVFTRTLVDSRPTQDSVPVATAHTIYGTPAYMSPEILIGEPASPASDAYALGVMLYESIAGKRPFGGATLYELIANVIDGDTPARLDHPLGEMIARLLDRDPAKRPSLEEADEELRAFVLRTPAVPIRPSAKRIASPPQQPAQRPRRWPLLLLAVILVAVVPAAIVVAMIERSTPDLESTQQLTNVRVAVTPIDIKTRSRGGDYNSAQSMTDSIAVMLGAIDGVTVIDIGHKESPDPMAAARKQRVKYVVRGALIEDELRQLRAELEVVDVATGQPTHVASTSVGAARFGSMMVDLGQKLGRVIQPTRILTPDRAAQVLYRAGRQRYEETDWAGAIGYLELAVQIDDSKFDAWFTLAMVRSWLQSDQKESAIESAYARRPRDGSVRAQMVEGALLYFQNRFADAIRVLAPLEAKVTADQTTELFYFLGEAYWHDGQHDRGYGYLSKVIKLQQNKDGVTRFKPMAIHCGEYAAGRRRALDVMLYSSLVGNSDTVGIGLINREYDKLVGDLTTSYDDFRAANGATAAAFREAAQIILDIDAPPTKRVGWSDADLLIWRVARAIEHGTLAEIRRELEPLWRQLDAEPPNGTTWFALESLGEVLLSHRSLTEEAAKLVAIQHRLANRTPAPRGYERFAWLLAALTGDLTTVPPRERLTTRMNKLADAVEAELRGDRATAARLLEELVADPSGFWDYPERAALVRIYKALGKAAQIDKLCADSMEPAIFRAAFRPLRVTCREAGFQKRKR